MSDLESEAVKPYLIRDLALQEKTQRALALEYGCSPAAISMFRKRHEGAIEAYNASLPSKLDDLWVTDKNERIKALQVDLELLADHDDIDAIKLRAAILKQIEESLGQLPPKTQINITKAVNYEIRGVDLNDLQ